ncbi:N-6 DNA Methylase [Methanosarcina thermophila]|jgi:hypothetical protein|uniref:site-specific DNA-methyltransferase (adenine-specific) n=1 Tax=Methanosarcina thermophila TaxID=2210 RepID=A0A1I7ADX6_METTE|nr:N-6 DNA methylase [Methanosarcina thermophila]GLI14217.1 hypothetical protein MTHERMMSTA1_13430 [Methanosarcina thermophila MST-A1]SFT73149.1 N-6 DNA Methylase [Methanosarcina thermophila]
MTNHLKEFQKGIESLAGRYHIWQVFEDWTEAAAIELHQATHVMVTGQKNPEIEKQYMDIVGRYNPDDVRKVFPTLFLHVVEGLQEPCDFLGQAFMELDLGSHWHGQFFTPYHLSKMMAQMTLQEVPEKEVLTISEPACGSGGMLVACAEVLQEKGINSMYRMHAVATDVDQTCFNMAYVQLSLLGISAEVCLGNTLSCETRKCWRTFASVLTGHTIASLTNRKRLIEMPREIRQDTFEAWGAC